MLYGLLAATTEEPVLLRALEIVEQWPEMRAAGRCRSARRRRWRWNC
jgi:hypothetical protein